MRALHNTTRRYGIGLVLVLTLTWSSIGFGGDWPQWRGPNRDGISPESGLLKAWPAGGPPLVWKATGLGSGYSTVAILKGRAYTTGDRSDAGFVIALDLKDGKTVWATKLGKTGAPGWGGFAGPRATPTVGDDLLYAVDQWGEMVCLDTGTGQERWRKDFGKDFGGSRPEWGFSESPLVDGDQVVVTPGGPNGALVALNRQTGALVWQSREFTDAAHYSSLIVVEIDGVRQYIQLTADHVVGIAAADGKLLWRAVRKGKTAVIPTPVYSDGQVYVSSGYSAGCNLFKITASGGSFQAEQVYAEKVIDNHHGGVIKIGDYIYGHADRSGWTCQNFKTGEVKWQEKGKVGKGAVVYAGERLYLRQEDKPGLVALIEASPEGYKEHGRFEQPDLSGKKTWPHPVVSNGRLYLRDQDVLLCYDVSAK